MVSDVKLTDSKITWETRVIFTMWLTWEDLPYCGWHHSLAGILCSLSEKGSWAAACIHPSLLPDGGCNVMTNCFNLLLPWPPNQGGLSPCPWSWINLLPSVALVRVFSHRNENETKTAGQGINKSRERDIQQNVTQEALDCLARHVGL